MKKITRIGVGGPVGSGKTAIIEAITPIFIKMGAKVLIITNDIVTTNTKIHISCRYCIAISVASRCAKIQHDYIGV